MGVPPRRLAELRADPAAGRIRRVILQIILIAKAEGPN
jgi:hypothetical protein